LSAVIRLNRSSSRGFGRVTGVIDSEDFVILMSTCEFCSMPSVRANAAGILTARLLPHRWIRILMVSTKKIHLPGGRVNATP